MGPAARFGTPKVQTDLLALCRPPPHLERMNEAVTRLNAALEGRYGIQHGPAQATRARSLDPAQLPDRRLPEPRKVVKRQ